MAAAPGSGRPRQADLRRAISAAYYAVFHAVMSAAADQIVGVGADRNTPNLYTLVYRSADHGSLRALCQDITKSILAAKYVPFAPPGGFNSNLKSFAAELVELQEKRHSCDYDPLFRVTKSGATLAISAGRAALNHFDNVPADEKVVFLSLLLFKAR